jgi:hypothetical protein
MSTKQRQERLARFLQQDPVIQRLLEGSAYLSLATIMGPLQR